ncbi:FAD-dependent oxidoreductase [Amycolatopsis methanolica]|uniref:FAD-dependent oxidoreductase n=1 Tax=Amycolatopsis methanolica TaxID=1814 RepID=UPI0003A7A16D|nr:FAD-dependent oxidoreductase [Amycolatopsis methanolica]
MPELDTEILVVGGGLGGVAAALAAAGGGHRVVLTEETDWLGGRLTAQAVPPDENPWIERFGSTATYRRLREGIRGYYRRHYQLRAEAARLTDPNPGSGRVSKLCHEPRVALAVLEAMLAPHRAAGRVTVLLEHRPVAAETTGDRVDAVTLEGRDGARTTVRAGYVLDATENGDLLPMTGTEFAVGAESRDEHGEPHAPEHADPANLQGITYCFALFHHAGQDHVIDRPEMYDFWRSCTPEFWPGPLLGVPRARPAHAGTGRADLRAQPGRRPARDHRRPERRRP